VSKKDGARKEGERSSFRAALMSGRVLLMDGAMGSELQKLGFREGNMTAWNVLHPERVRAVHASYAAAGAEVFLSNTFLANDSSWLGEVASHGYRSNLAAWEPALALMPSGAYRVAAVGPVGGRFAQREFDDLDSFTVPSDEYTTPPLPDATLLETCSTPRVRLALARARRWSERPLLLSLTYLRKAGRLVTYSGHPPEWFAARAEGWGVDALGVNCGRDIGVSDMIEIVRRYRAVTELPLFARPNAGTPTKKRGGWVYPHTPAAMAAELEGLLEAGACMVGGCCGTTPEHVAAFKAVIDSWNTVRGARKGSVT
jgi:methionine synthase I (cobalamin-dependent)